VSWPHVVYALELTEPLRQPEPALTHWPDLHDPGGQVCNGVIAAVPPVRFELTLDGF
jgi:hypothetical protein